MVSPRCTEHPPHVLMVSPHMYHDIPRCTEHPPMYSWYPPDVLMVSLRCTEHPPMYSWYPSDVLNTPRCTHDIPPMYSWYPPDVLMVSRRCTDTPRCTEHTLYRVVFSDFPEVMCRFCPLCKKFCRVYDLVFEIRNNSIFGMLYYLQY